MRDESISEQLRRQSEALTRQSAKLMEKADLIKGRTLQLQKEMKKQLARLESNAPKKHRSKS
jgi:hypothetical protein